MKVKLLHCGLKKISVIKTVREFTGLCLKDAKHVADVAPVEIAGAYTNIQFGTHPRTYLDEPAAPFTRDEAQRFAEELVEAGAKAEVVYDGVPAEILCIVDTDGRYNAVGWSNAAMDDLKMDSIITEFDAEGRETHFVWVNAIIPLPQKPPTVTGTSEIAEEQRALGDEEDDSVSS